MSLTRKALKDLALTEEQAEAVISMHADTVEALKNEIAAQTRQAQTAREESEAIRLEYEEYRDCVSREAERRRRGEIYRSCLREAGVAEKRHDAILRVTELEDLPLEAGAEDRPALLEQIRREWGELIPEKRLVGAPTPRPPEPEPMTKAAILAIPDRQERRTVMAQHLNLF